MRVYDVYDVRRGVIIATVHSPNKEKACSKVASIYKIDIAHLAAALQ